MDSWCNWKIQFHSIILPSSSVKVKSWLSCDVETWEYIDLEIGTKIEDFDILFERLDKEIIVEELNNLGN